ncbi:MAG TPA: bifunctional folylpolyglutamate synthase/dihydrofolate synthase [Epulopiscium sp.]|nr:bifunctional folylpolyglutamate synthase/dihydrofolate synthase [Candidatus Epulonipiscium sp.]
MNQQVIRFLEEMQTPAKTLGLGRIQNLMKRLGNPQDKLNIIHVAGTNGKGSVCAMLTSILMEAGYKVGLFTSPHLIAYNERIQINRVPIKDSDFENIASKVQKACEEIAKDNEEVPRFFEVITAMAFLHFNNQKVDIVVLETGIGGRYDATNIIKKPLLSIITSIGKDHMDFLGHTIESISYEKGGIIKESCPTVLYDSDKSVYNMIIDICEKQNSLLLSCKNSLILKETYTMEGTTFSVRNKYFTYKDIFLQLLGKYQVSNALTTLMAIESLNQSAYNIPRDIIYKGLKNASWAGRMEMIQKEPTIVIDGAHNEESARAFIASLQSITKASKVYMLIGVLKGKDYKTILNLLVPFAHTVIVTQSSHGRALPAEKLYDEISKMEKRPNLILEQDLITAYEVGRKLLTEEPQETILCCLGSLYLVGELKQFLKN